MKPYSLAALARLCALALLHEGQAEAAGKYAEGRRVAIRRVTTRGSGKFHSSSARSTAFAVKFPFQSQTRRSYSMRKRWKLSSRRGRWSFDDVHKRGVPLTAAAIKVAREYQNVRECNISLICTGLCINTIMISEILPGNKEAEEENSKSIVVSGSCAESAAFTVWRELRVMLDYKYRPALY